MTVFREAVLFPANFTTKALLTVARCPIAELFDIICELVSIRPVTWIIH